MVDKDIIKRLSIDYDLPFHIVEEIYRKYNGLEVYERLEEILKNKTIYGIGLNQ